MWLTMALDIFLVMKSAYTSILWVNFMVVGKETNTNELSVEIQAAYFFEVLS